MRFQIYKWLIGDQYRVVRIWLPERGRARWGESLNAEKMKTCVWVKPELKAQIEFLERTEGEQLRHASFVRLS